MMDTMHREGIRVLACALATLSMPCLSGCHSYPKFDPMFLEYSGGKFYGSNATAEYPLSEFKFDAFCPSGLFQRTTVVLPDGTKFRLADLTPEFVLANCSSCQVIGGGQGPCECSSLTCFDPCKHYSVCLQGGGPCAIQLRISGAKVREVKIYGFADYRKENVSFQSDQGIQYSIPMSTAQAKEIWGEPESIDYPFRDRTR